MEVPGSSNCRDYLIEWGGKRLTSTVRWSINIGHLIVVISLNSTVVYIAIALPMFVSKEAECP